MILKSKRTKTSLSILMSILILGAACKDFSVAYAAEEESFSLDQIVVTATRTPLKEFDANANISVITRDELAKNHYADLGEALKDVAGVTIQNYGSSGENYTANSLYINGSKNIVVLIDGMRANVNGSTFSKFMASEVSNLDTIERIEILKGSASTLYGSDAQGGVINIITRKLKDEESKTTLSAVTGSYGKEQYNYLHMGSKDGFYWILSGQKKLSGNYRDAEGTEIPEKLDSTTNTIKVGKRTEKADVSVAYTAYDSDYTAPEGGNNKLTRTRIGTKDNDKLNLVYNQKFDDNTDNQFSFFKNNNKLDDNPEGVFGTHWVMDLETIGVHDQITHRIGKDHTLIGGFEFYQDKIKDYLTKSAYSTVHYSGKSLTNRALYVQDEWNFTPEWKLTSGIRLDNHSVYGNHNTPSFTLGYKPSEKVSYYTSWKEYYVAPNQGQVYSPQYNMPEGNMTLKPETGKTIEAGVNYKFDDTFTGSFHVFKRDSENIIAFKTIDSSAGMSTLSGQYYNIAEEHAKGFDVELRKLFDDHFSANAAYTYTYIDPSGSTTNPNQDGYLPRGAWNLGLNYDNDKFNTAINGRGVINRDGRKAQPVVAGGILSTFWVWDISMNYKASKVVNAFVKVNNVFDKFYTDQCYNLNPDQWYSAPGRNYQVGLQYSF